MKNKNLEN